MFTVYIYKILLYSLVHCELYFSSLSLIVVNLVVSLSPNCLTPLLPTLDNSTYRIIPNLGFVCLIAEKSKRRQQLRQGIHERADKINTNRQIVHHESGSNGICRIFIRESRIRGSCMSCVWDSRMIQQASRNVSSTRILNILYYYYRTTTALLPSSVGQTTSLRLNADV